MKKLLTHAAAALVILIATFLGLGLIKLFAQIGVLGAIVGVVLAFAWFKTIGVVLKKLGYNLDTSPLYRETKAVKIAGIVIAISVLIFSIALLIWGLTTD